MSYPVATKASTAVLAQAASLNSADSKFQLFYFGLQARAEIPRLMLAYAGANFEHVSAVRTSLILLWYTLTDISVYSTLSVYRLTFCAYFSSPLFNRTGPP